MNEKIRFIMFPTVIFMLFSSLLFAQQDTGLSLHDSPHEAESSIELSQYRIYEAYRNNAQYEKAIEILYKLIEKEPSNDRYLIELGGLYLHGFVDLEKAKICFEKALEINKFNPITYILLGEVCKLKYDFKNATIYFSQAIEMKPSLDTLFLAKNNLRDIELTKQKLLIKDWWFIGAFNNVFNTGIKIIFPPEKEIILDKTYPGKNDIPITWKRVYDNNAFGFVDFNAIFSQKDFSIAYALTYIYSDKERKILALFGSDDSAKVWLNDENVFTFELDRRALVDDNHIIAHLKKGWNKVLVKVCQTYGGWGFYFRVTDINGKPVPQIIFDPNKNDDYARSFLNQYRFKRLLKLFVSVLILILLGFLLTIFIMFLIEKYKLKRLKDDFISSVSHEMKTPITSIKMFADTLLLDRIKDPRKKKEYLYTIIKQSDKLTDYINNILDFSRLESGQMMYDFKEYYIVDTIQQIANNFSQHFHDSEISVSISKQLKERLFYIDINSFERAILNIMFNAYNYSHGKPIEIYAEHKQKRLYLSVTDHGIGLSRNEIKHIFKKFYRVNAPSAGNIKGTGLGLTIVKKIIHANKGSISVRSTLGEGSTFTISMHIL
ncbi:ATP-binding protein [Chlamydiota bacterium]